MLTTNAMAGFTLTSHDAAKERAIESPVVDTSDEVALDHDNSEQVLSPAVNVQLHVDEAPVEKPPKKGVAVEGVLPTTANTPNPPVHVRVLTAIDVPMPAVC